MPRNQTNINIGVKYNVDQSSVNAVKKSLQDLQHIKVSDFSGTKKQLNEIKDTAKQVESALDSAFNVNLNSLNVQTFNQQLKSAGLSVDQVYQTFSKAGAQGQVAFRNMTSSILTTNLQLKLTKGLLTSMGETMVNTVKWGIASSVMNSFTNSVQQAFQYAKSLDGALTDIRIVTGDSTEQMRQFAKLANNAAQNLGRSTMDYTKAALSFYQQGLNDELVQTRTETVLKAQNITGAGLEMADYLTAVWNGYKVANLEAELYVDKLAAVADSSASNMSLLAVAMSKVASSANALGVPVDNLNAQIATIVATTRQAPESVGNALKTIYSRINDITTGADDAEVSLGNYSKQMASIGFSVLDANGNLRDTGDVLDEIGGKWLTLSREQQIYLARTMAGQRQYNNLIALFDNWGKYTDLVNVSMEAQGTTMLKNARYMDSLEAKMEQLGAAGERVKDALIDELDLKGLASFGALITNVFASFIEGIGGGRGALLNLVSVITTLFAPAISKELTSAIIHFQQARDNAHALAQEILQVRELGTTKAYSEGAISSMVDAKRLIQLYYNTMTTGQIQSYNAVVENIGANENLLDVIREEEKSVKDFEASVTQAGAAFGNDLSTQLAVAADVTRDLKEELRDLSVSDLKDKDVFNELVRQVQELQVQIGDRTVPAFIEFDNVLSKIKNTGQATTNDLAKLRMTANAALNQTNDLLSKDLDVIRVKASDTEKELRKLKDAKDAAISLAKAGAFSRTLTTYISSITQIISAFNNLSRIVSVLKDDSLTAGEKISQTLTSSVFTIGMLVSAYTRISSVMGIQQFKANQRWLTEKAITLEKEKQAALDKYNATNNAFYAGKASIEEVQKTYEAWQLLEGQQQRVTTSLGQIGTVGQFVGGKITTGIKSIIGFLTGSGGLVVAIGAVVAIVGILLYRAWNAAAIAAKKAALTAKQAKEQYDSIKESVKDLNSSLSNLASARDNLDSLTKGTKEWNSALQDVNDQVLLLIEKFPELKGFLTSDNGVLGLKPEAELYIQNIYRQRQFASGLTYAATDRQSTLAANKSLIVNASRNLFSLEFGLIGFSADNLEAVINAIHLHGNWILENSDTLSQFVSIGEEEIDAVLNHRDAINKLAELTQKNTAASENLTNTIIGNLLNNVSEYQNSSNQLLFATMVANLYKNAELNRLQYSRVTASGQKTDVLDEKLLALRWAESLGLTYGETIKVSFGRIQQKIDGKWKSVSLDMVATAVAQYDALQNIDLYYKQIELIINNLGGLQSEILVNYLKGSFENLSLKDILALQNPDNSLLREAIAKNLEGGEELLDADLAKYATSIQENTNRYYKKLASESGRGVVSALDLIDPDRNGLSAVAREKVTEVLKAAFVKGKGILGLEQQVADVFKDAFNSDKIDELLNIDVSNLELDDFKTLLKLIGIETTASDLSLQLFLNTLKGFSENLLSAEEIYNNVHSIIDKKNGKTLEYNDLINELDYNKLKLAGVNVENAFVKLTSGMYKFIGDATEFYNEANQVSLNPFLDKIDLLKERIEELNNTDLSYEDLNQSQYIQNERGGWDVNYDLVQLQVDALYAGNIIDDSQLAKYNELIQLRLIDSNSLSEIKKAILDNELELTNFIEKESLAARLQLHMNELQLAYSQQDLGELRNLRTQNAFDSLSTLEYVNSLLNVADALGIVIKNVLALAEEWIKNADSIEGVNEVLKDNASLSYDLAAAMEDLIMGVESIQKSWKETLKEGVSLPTAEVVEETRAALSDMFNVDIDSDFVYQNLDLISQLAQGNMDAIGQLRAALGSAKLEALLLSLDLKLQISTDLNWDSFDSGLAELQNLILNSSDRLNKIEVGTNIELAPFYLALDRFVQAAGLTESQINLLFGSIGYLPEVTTRTIDAISDVSGNQETGYYITTDVGNGQVIQSYITQDQYNRLSSGTAIQVPVIHPHSYRYTGGGKSVSNYGGNRVTPKAPKSSGGGKKGGGGGKGSTKKPTVVKPQQLSEAKESITDRSDVYHDVNLALKEQEDKLDDIENKLKKLVNRDRLENLQEQNKELEKQKDLLDLKSGIAASELVRLRNELIGDLGNSIQFDPDGAIANYNAALDKARDNYNDSIADYNRKVADAEKAYNNYVANYNSMSALAQEKNKTLLDRQKDLMDQIKKLAQRALDVEKEKYDAIKSNVKEYLDTLDLQKDIADQQQEIILKMYENLIAMSKIKVDLSLDTGEFERDWLEFENKFIKKLSDDDFLGSAKANVKELMSYFNSDQVQLTAKQIEKIRDEIAIMLRGGTSAIYGDNLAQAKEDLELYMKQQMEDLESIQDLVDDIKDNYLDALDDAKLKMDDQIDQYERVNDLIEHNVKLVDLLYGDKAYDTMNKYYDLQKANNERELQSLKMQQDYWQNLMNNETVGSEAWKEMKKNLDDVTDNLNSKLEDMILNLSDQWLNRIDGIIAKFNNALSGGRGLDYLDLQWDYINNFDDNFLDTFESRMGIQEVTDLYKLAIDGLYGSPSNQQKINKLMNDQLKILREKDNLTQYDIDRAKAALEVEKARMALEEARYNKTKMRLRRDSQGNYTYQYVADELKLSELQSALADAQANLYNMDKEHYTENLNNLYDAYKDYLDKMRDLTEEYNNTQDEEERARIQSRIDLLKESANDLMGGLTEDNRYALQYLNNSFFGGMGIDTALMSADLQMELMMQNIPQVNSNIQDLANNIVGLGGLLNATHDALDLINKATVEYDLNIKQFLNDAGTSLETISEVTSAADTALDNNIINAQNLITTNDELIKSCEAQVAAIQELMSWLDLYMNKVMNVETLVANLRSAYNTGQQLNGSNLTADNISVTGMNLDTTAGNNFTGNPAVDAAAVKQQIDALMAEYEKFLAQMAIATFDTGGSTGSWGDASGRLAFLHEKELVLNQEDTLNILRAVQTVRAITSAFGSVADSGLSALANGANGFLAGINNTEQLDQNVHIEANFPNVTQHTEIEQAFENLVNMASMKASKYRD